jgi:hypothetical protein
MLGIWRRVVTGTGIASECTGEGKGLCFAGFRVVKMGEEGQGETEEPLSKKGSKESTELTEEIAVTSTCEGFWGCEMGEEG